MPGCGAGCFAQWVIPFVVTMRGMRFGAVVPGEVVEMAWGGSIWRTAMTGLRTLTVFCFSGLLFPGNEMSTCKWKSRVSWMYCLIMLVLTVRTFSLVIGRYAHQQMRIGWEHYLGEQRDKEVERAFTLTRRAARLGNRSAKNNLGMFYAQGVGVDQDLDLAFHWFQRAEKKATTGYAHYNLGYMYYFLNMLNQLTPGQIAEAEVLSVELSAEYAVSDFALLSVNTKSGVPERF